MKQLEKRIQNLERVYLPEKHNGGNFLWEDFLIWYNVSKKFLDPDWGPSNDPKVNAAFDRFDKQFWKFKEYYGLK